MFIPAPRMTGDCATDQTPNRLVSQQSRRPYEGHNIMTNNVRQDLLEIDGWTGWASEFDDRRLLDFVDNGFGDPRKWPVRISAPRCVGVV